MNAKGEDFIMSSVLEAFEFDSPSQVIQFETDKFVCLDPGTGTPRIGNVFVKYMPAAGKAVDPDTLQVYLQSFHDIEMRQEKITARIRADVQAVIGCNCIVETGFKVDGSPVLDSTCQEGWMDSPQLDVKLIRETENETHG